MNLLSKSVPRLIFTFVPTTDRTRSIALDQCASCTCKANVASRWFFFFSLPFGSIAFEQLMRLCSARDKGKRTTEKKYSMAHTRKNEPTAKHSDRIRLNEENYVVNVYDYRAHTPVYIPAASRRSVALSTPANNSNVN